MAYLQAENAYAAAVTKPLKPFEDTLYREMLGRLQETDRSVPYLAHVPFADVLSTMLDASLPLTVGEYEEWGNPNIKQYYQYMRQYSPYDNITRQAYPVMLVKTSLNDSQVMYWEPAKYIAKLRALKTDTHPLLLVTNMGAGHGGASGRYDHLHEIAYDFAFVLDQVGIHV